MVSQNSINNTVQDNDFSVNRADAGVTVQSSVDHSDNTSATSNAKFLAETGGAAGGDPHVNFSVDGVQDYSLGIDNSDSDDLKLTNGVDPSTGTSLLECTTGGTFTYPLQPAFAAYLSAPALNVTGNGTVYTIICDTELFDIGGNYDNTTGLFTAPEDGIYLFISGIIVDDVAAATGGNTNITIGANGFLNNNSDPSAIASSSGFAGYTLSAIGQMTAAQTAFMQVTVNGIGADTADVQGAGASQTYFQGFKLA